MSEIVLAVVLIGLAATWVGRLFGEASLWIGWRSRLDERQTDLWEAMDAYPAEDDLTDADGAPLPLADPDEYPWPLVIDADGTRSMTLIYKQSWRYRRAMTHAKLIELVTCRECSGDHAAWILTALAAVTGGLPVDTNWVGWVLIAFAAMAVHTELTRLMRLTEPTESEGTTHEHH